MRITFIAAGADMSGGCKVIATHGKLLLQRGHDVTVVAPPPPPPRTLLRRVKALIAGTPSGSGQGSHFALQGVPISLLDRFRPVGAGDIPDADVVVATWWRTAQWIEQFPRKKGAKAYFVQGWERHIDGQPGDEVDRTLRLPYHKLVISRFLVDVMAKVADDHDVTLVPNAIDPAQFNAAPRSKQARPTVGFVYSNFQLKGLDVIARAVGRIREEMPSVRLVSFGLEPIHHAKHLPPGVEYHQSPPQHEIPMIYASADVWLSASRIEGFGLPALEAMACRTPLVSTRYGGPLGFVEPGKNGWLVDVDDADALAERALAVLRMPDGEWTGMSEAAHRTGHADTWASSSLKFEAGLERAIEKARPT